MEDWCNASDIAANETNIIFCVLLGQKKANACFRERGKAASSFSNAFSRNGDSSDVFFDLERRYSITSLDYICNSSMNSKISR